VAAIDGLCVDPAGQQTQGSEEQPATGEQHPWVPGKKNQVFDNLEK
jgi:hypothetical protein